MKYYFGAVTIRKNPKNKLEDAIQNFIKKFDRVLIPGDQIEDYKHKIISDIESLNAKFPRCKPIDASWWHVVISDDEPVDFVLRGIHDYGIFRWLSSKEGQE